jgi:hypothetical protein
MKRKTRQRSGEAGDVGYWFGHSVQSKGARKPETGGLRLRFCDQGFLAALIPHFW